MDDSRHQNFVLFFENVLRSSALAGVIDLRRATLALSALLERVPVGGTLALGPLYDFLVHQKAPEQAVREVIVFIKSHEERFSLKMDLPAQLVRLPEVERTRIITAFTAREPSLRTQAVGVSVVRQLAASRMLWLSLALVGFGGLLLYQVAGNLFKPGRARSTPIVVDVAGGLPCVKAEIRNRSLACFVPQAFAAAHKRPDVLKQANVTLSVGETRGLSLLLVYTVEDSKLQWMFRENKRGFFARGKKT